MTTQQDRAELIDLVSDAAIDADLPPEWCLQNHEKLRRFAAALLAADAQRGEAVAYTAGLESATGHLSALVDDLRGLMARAMANMKALHNASKPVNESMGDFDAVIPYDVFRRFVNEHAALLADLHNSPHELPSTHPQPERAPVGINGLTESETAASASVMGLTRRNQEKDQ